MTDLKSYDARVHCGKNTMTIQLCGEAPPQIYGAVLVYHKYKKDNELLEKVQLRTTKEISSLRTNKSAREPERRKTREDMIQTFHNVDQSHFFQVRNNAMAITAKHCGSDIGRYFYISNSVVTH